jgi:hypothetical protein
MNKPMVPDDVEKRLRDLADSVYQRTVEGFGDDEPARNEIHAAFRDAYEMGFNVGRSTGTPVQGPHPGWDDFCQRCGSGYYVKPGDVCNACGRPRP